MRTYLILKEKARQFREDSDIQALLPRDSRRSRPTLDVLDILIRRYSRAEQAERLKATRRSIARRSRAGRCPYQSSIRWSSSCCWESGPDASASRLSRGVDRHQLAIDRVASRGSGVTASTPPAPQARRTTSSHETGSPVSRSRRRERRAARRQARGVADLELIHLGAEDVGHHLQNLRGSRPRRRSRRSSSRPRPSSASASPSPSSAPRRCARTLAGAVGAVEVDSGARRA